MQQSQNKLNCSKQVPQSGKKKTKIKIKTLSERLVPKGVKTFIFKKKEKKEYFYINKNIELAIRSFAVS